MSLPTYALFFDANGDVVAKQFVNVGWWVDADNFADAIMSLPNIKNATTVELYGVSIPTSLFYSNDSLDGWTKSRKRIADNIQSYLDEFNRVNVDIKDAIKTHYLKVNNGD